MNKLNNTWLNTFQDNAFHDLTRLEVRLTDRFFPGSCFLPFFKMGTVSLFPFTRVFPDCHDKYNAEWLGNCISQFPQDPGMHLVGSHGLVCTQVLLMVMNQSSPMTGGTSYLQLLPWGSGLEICGKRDFHCKIEAKRNCWAPKPFPCQLSLVLLCYLSGWRRKYIFFNLSFLVNIPVEALLILLIPCQIQCQLFLSFPDPFSTHLGSIPIFFPCSHVPGSTACAFPSRTLGFTRRSLLGHSGFLPSLLDLLHVGI